MGQRFSPKFVEGFKTHLIWRSRSSCELSMGFKSLTSSPLSWKVRSVKKIKSLQSHCDGQKSKVVSGTTRRSCRGQSRGIAQRKLASCVGHNSSCPSLWGNNLNYLLKGVWAREIQDAKSQVGKVGYDLIDHRVIQKVWFETYVSIISEKFLW